MKMLNLQLKYIQLVLDLLHGLVFLEGPAKKIHISRYITLKLFKKFSTISGQEIGNREYCYEISLYQNSHHVFTEMPGTPSLPMSPSGPASPDSP